MPEKSTIISDTSVGQWIPRWFTQQIFTDHRLCARHEARNLFHGNGLCSCGIYLLVRKREIHKQADKKVITNPCVINETTRNWEKEEQEKTVRQGLSEELTFEPRQTGWRTGAECSRVMWRQQQQSRKAGGPRCAQTTGQCWLKTGKWVVDQRQEPYHLRVCSPLKGFWNLSQLQWEVPNEL